MMKIKKRILKFFMNNFIKLKNTKYGVAIVETAITLPIVVMMIFFILEMMKVNNARTAMDTLALEGTMDFVANGNTNNFQSIIDKYRPKNIDEKYITYYFAVYKDLDTMCKESPYGSEEIYWPNSNGEVESFINSSDNTVHLARVGDIQLSDFRKPETSFSKTAEFGTIHGKAFVLTFVCDFPFSSALVSKLFVGGSNTTDKKKFLIWGRGVGICH